MSEMDSASEIVNQLIKLENNYQSDMVYMRYVYFRIFFYFSLPESHFHHATSFHLLDLM